MSLFDKIVIGVCVALIVAGSIFVGIKAATAGQGFRELKTEITRSK